MQKIFIFFFFGILIISAFYFFFVKGQIRSTSDVIVSEGETISKPTLVSRDVMAFAIEIVKEKKPTPAMAARFYAYVASVYADVLKATGDTEDAVLASAQIIRILYSDKAASTTSFLGQKQIDSTRALSDDAESIVQAYANRSTGDTIGATPVRPEGEAYWVGENPFDPSAGAWKRWNTEGMEFDVPPPPEFMSTEHMAAVKEVKEAAEMRSSEQGAAVNFWGGVPGTESPAGIWQNRLFTIVGDEGYSDLAYAEAQKAVAQATADAFMECWKVKFTHWTKRPSMVDGTIQLAMNNPPFPSYLSGHSTVSRAAAEVLAVLFPQHRDEWLSDAEEAKNSRLWAGIHYAYDNERGAVLGQEVGRAVVEKLALTAL